MHELALRLRGPGTSLIRSAPIVVSSLYVMGLLLLQIAFAYSDNAALRDALFATFSLSAPPVIAARAAMLFAGAVLCLVVGYALVFNLASAPFAAARMWKLLIALHIVFLALPPFLSTDVLSYYQQGWLIAEKGVSPYKTAPGAFAEFPGIEFMKGANHDVLSPYGPLWSHIEAAVYWLSGGALWLGVALFKVLAAVAALLLTFLVWKILTRTDPANAMRGAVLVGANPLLLIEAAGMAHNDLVALVVGFAGAALLVRGGGRAAVVGLAMIGAAVLFKALVAIVPLGLAIYWLRSLGTGGLLRLALKALLLWAPLAAVSSFPFVRSFADIPLLFGMVNAGLPYEIKFTPVNLLKNALVHYSAALGTSIDASMTKGVLLVLAFAAVAGFMFYLLSRARTLVNALFRLSPVFLAATIAASYWRQWYAVWPLPFAALNPGGPWSRAAVIYSAAALLTYAMTRSGGVYFM